MLKTVRKCADRLIHPLRTFRAVQLRLDIICLKLRNRFSSSAVATGNPGVVVSLTTYARRIGVVHLVIESIARGHVTPSRLILWLDDHGILDDLPKPLRRLQKRGLEIRQCENYGPHKKYYSFVEREQFLICPLVTADDDVIYPASWLEGLIEANRDYPKCVNCYRARKVKLCDGRIAPYREWRICDSDVPSVMTLATGVSGVIYPSSLLEVLKEAGTKFQTLCPRSDDLWLHVWAIRSGYEVRQVQRQAIHFPHIPGTQVTSLYLENCAENDGNDRQITSVYGPLDVEIFEQSTAVAHL